MSNKYQPIVKEIRRIFQTPEGFIPLHAPYFGGNEKKYLLDTIDSTFVSSVGSYVNRFEQMMQEVTGAKYAIATTNGTSALHLSLVICGVQPGNEVITQPLTFVATANAISHAGALPVFLDVDRETMGLSPTALEQFLAENTFFDNNGNCINKFSKNRIAACLPMHTFGFPVKISALMNVCKRYNITLIEDAAESLGSFSGAKHTGRFGLVGTFSFNGNKTVTCGGGGAIITDDEVLAQKFKHLSTTAKVAHPYEFYHNEVAFNYRLPNLNAALACAQLEQLSTIIENKRALAHHYQEFFEDRDETLFLENVDTKANYWLNTVIFPDRTERDLFLEYANSEEVMVRPIWRLMNELPMYKNCQKGDLTNAVWLENRVVNIPSSFRPTEE